MKDATGGGNSLLATLKAGFLLGILASQHGSLAQCPLGSVGAGLGPSLSPLGDTVALLTTSIELPGLEEG